MKPRLLEGTLGACYFGGFWGVKLGVSHLLNMHEQPEAAATNAEICQILDSFAHFGVKLGLESTYRLLSYFDNPQDNVNIIHVAGTNGKGSVCAYLSTILTEAGYRVGRYTSPHLVSWGERICIEERPIDAPSLLRILQQIQAVIQAHHLDATQFEVITAAAWLYFVEQSVDIAVIEVGLGGRLDATNVCDRPLVSVITSIANDHWQQLGNTLGKIATEKAGILKAQCPAVVGPVSPDAKAAIAHRAEQLECPTTWVAPAIALDDNTVQFDASSQTSLTDPSLADFSRQEPPMTPIKTPITYTLALKGPHQHINSAVAIATIQRLQAQGWQITTDHIQTGLAKTQWPGRMQWINWNDHALLVDGAHNTAAAIALRQYVDTLPQPVHWIVGMLATKDHPGVLDALLKRGDRLSLVPVPDSNTAQPEDLARIAHQCCPDLAQCQSYDDICTVLNHHTVNQHTNLGTIVVCGSLYLIGYVFKYARTVWE